MRKVVEFLVEMFITCPINTPFCTILATWISNRMSILIDLCFHHPNIRVLKKVEHSPRISIVCCESRRAVGFGSPEVVLSTIGFFTSFFFSRTVTFYFCLFCMKIRMVDPTGPSAHLLFSVPSFVFDEHATNCNKGRSG